MECGARVTFDSLSNERDGDKDHHNATTRGCALCTCLVGRNEMGYSESGEFELKDGS